MRALAGAPLVKRKDVSQKGVGLGNPASDARGLVEESSRHRTLRAAYLDGSLQGALAIAALPASILAIVLVSALAAGGFERAYEITRVGTAIVAPIALAALLVIISFPLTHRCSRETLRVLRGVLLLPVIALFWGLMSDWQWPPLLLVAVMVLGAFRAAQVTYWDRLLDDADRRRAQGEEPHPLQPAARLRLLLAVVIMWGGMVVALPAYVWQLLRH